MRMLRNLIHEAHRRYVWQVLAVYAVAAWIGHQFVGLLYDGLGLHEWVPALAAVLFLIGLPMVAATAFVNRRPPKRADLIPPAPEPLPLPEFPYDIPYAGAGAATTPLAPVSDVRTPLLSWRRSLALGALAFALLGLGASSYVGMRQFGIGPAGTLLSRGVLVPGAELVLADFAGPDPAAPQTVPAPDPGTSLGTAVTEALRLELTESPTFRLVERIRVERVVAPMARRDAPAVGSDVAYAAAVLLGAAGVIEGELAVHGSGYVLRARITNADGSRTLATFREHVRDPADLLDAVHRLGRRVRADIGESLRVVRAAPAVTTVATASLPAMLHYAASLRASAADGDPTRQLLHAQHAVAIDSTFALAWLRLGTLMLHEAHDGTAAAEVRRALTRTWELRARLRPHENLIAEALHVHRIIGDPARAVPLYQAALRAAPRDEAALHELPVALFELRRFAEAETPLQAAIEHGVATAHHWTLLAAVQYAMGRRDDAHATVVHARDALPTDPALRRLEATVAIADGDWRRADALTRAWLARAPAPLPRRAAFQVDLWQIARAQGRLALATGHLREAEELLRRLDSRARRVRLRLAEIEMTALTRVDRTAALRLLEELEESMLIDSLPPAERPYLRLAEAYAWAGDPDAAEELLDAFETAGLPPTGDDAATFTRGVIQLARGDVIAAVASLRNYVGIGACTVCGLPVLGHALEAAEEAEAALEAYERYLDTPYLMRRDSDATWRAFVLGRAAELHERLGSHERAVERYSEFVQLWQHADAELQPQVAAARRRTQALRSRIR